MCARGSAFDRHGAAVHGCACVCVCVCICGRGCDGVIKVKIRVPHGTVYLATDHFCLISVKHSRETQATVIKARDQDVCVAYIYV